MAVPSVGRALVPLMRIMGMFEYAEWQFPKKISSATVDVPLPCEEIEDLASASDEQQGVASDAKQQGVASDADEQQG
eukprot:1854607-Pyramimonas_sp.AAC.1